MLHRYHPTVQHPDTFIAARLNWLYHLVNTKRPLQEKIALFWHNVFATGLAKVEHDGHMSRQVEMFREYGMGNYRDLLVRLAKDPAMIFWLDNNENHKRAPNENWGRELLELFSLGVGNYTEEDVYECSRAFTGWTITAKIPTQPYHGGYWNFAFRPKTTTTQKGIPGPYWDIQRQGNHRHYCAAAFVRQVHFEAPVQFLRPPTSPRYPLGASSLRKTRRLSRFFRRAFVNSGYEIKPVLRNPLQLRLFQGGDVPEGEEPCGRLWWGPLGSRSTAGPRPPFGVVGQ